MFLNKNLFVLFFVTLFQNALVCSEASALSFIIDFNQIEASDKTSFNDEDFLRHHEDGKRLLGSLSEENTYKDNFLMCGRLYKSIPNKDDVNPLVGIVLFKKMATEKNTLCVNLLRIDPQYQKMGLGTRVIETLSKEFKPATIKLVSTKDALPFYRKLGFIELLKGTSALKKDYPQNQ